MKKTVFAVAFFLVMTLGFALPTETLACSISANGLREGQPITWTITFDASDVGKHYQVLEYDPHNTLLLNNPDYYVAGQGTLTETVTSAIPGSYQLQINNTPPTLQMCSRSIDILPLAATPPTAIPPVEIASPNQWLKLINPGFGAVGANLGANFGLNFFTNNVANFVISLALFILFTGSLIMLLYGGILWITSGGDKEGAAKAKNTVTYAIIGLALGLASFIIVNILGTFFGLNLVGP